MEQETQRALEELRVRMEEIHSSVEKTRKYMLMMLYVSIAVIVLPLIGLAFVVPMVLNTLGSAYAGLL